MDKLEFNLRFYPSENSVGYNTLIRITEDQVGEDTETEKLERAVLFLSFDEVPPKFLWHESTFSYGEEEYLELRAQREVENFLLRHKV